jgi:cystathionine gamma-synthase
VSGGKDGAWRPKTLAAQALGRVDAPSGAIVSPLHLTTTFQRDPAYADWSGDIYGRPDNPTVREAEAVIGALEGAEDTLALGSGMSAAIALFLSLGPGARVVAPHSMYWALRNWLMKEAPAHGLEVAFCDVEDLSALAAAIAPQRTKLVWLETPSNPMWSVTDIAESARLAHSAGALIAVDSTCATPIFTRPLALGADVVMHSATKYLNGHSDAIAGALCFAHSDGLVERARNIRKTHGLILHPFGAFLLTRGLRTLELRVRACALNALKLAHRLSTRPDVQSVLYPGLPAHPGHKIALKQMQGGFGGMLSIRLRGGAEAAIATAARTRLWKRATSLGGVESLIEHRASYEGPDSPCPPDLLRLSAGVEDIEDLWRDLDQALRG